MPILISCAAGIAVLAGLVLSGVMSGTDLAHPFWQTRASLIGGAVGTVLGVGLLWVAQARPTLTRTIGASLGFGLSVAIFITWRAARTFIDSADFEARAGQIWFLGYHMIAALTVAFVALLVIGFLRKA